MLAEHLRQAEALESVLDGAPLIEAPGTELAQAVLSCVEKLLLWGHVERALRLVRRCREQSAEIPRPEVLQMEIVELRALSQLRLDHECLERIDAILASQREARYLPDAELTSIRIIQGEALWHLNRSADARNVLLQVRAELLSKPSHLTTAACSATLAAALVAAGSWAEARDFAVEALVLARRAGARFYEGFALSLVCMIDRALCRWHGAIEAGELASRVYEQIDARLQSTFVKRHLAVALWK